jgi:WXG100 family type VII secretion target
MAETTLTPDEFRVDLGQMHDAIGSLKTDSAKIMDLLGEIATQFKKVQNVWKSPATRSFEEVQQWFSGVTNDMHEILDEAASRLNSAYQNYLDTEQKNVQNLDSNGGDGNGGGGNGGGHNNQELSTRHVFLREGAAVPAQQDPSNTPKAFLWEGAQVNAGS